MTVYELIFQLEELAEKGYKFNKVEIEGTGALVNVFKYDCNDSNSPVILLGAIR